MSSNGPIGRYKRFTKYLIFFHPQLVLRRFICPKFVFGRGSAPDPAGGAHDAPPDPLDGPPPHSSPPSTLNLSVPNFISRKLATLRLARPNLPSDRVRRRAHTSCAQLLLVAGTIGPFGLKRPVVPSAFMPVQVGQFDRSYYEFW